MKLSERLAKLYNADKNSIKPEILHVLKDFTYSLKTAGIEENVIQPGRKAPTFRLVNAMGFMVSLEDLLRHGSVVISFYRGSWCPYCNEEIKALHENLPKIHEQGANLVAISPELPDNSLSLIEKMNLKFEVLSDRHNMVARQYGVVFKLSEEIKKIYTIGKKFYKKNRKASRKGDRFTQLLYLKLILTNLDLSKTYNLDEEIKKSTEFIKKHHSRQSLLKFKEELDLLLKKYRFCSKCGGVLELKGLHNNLINPENILKCKICKNWKKIEK